MSKEEVMKRLQEDLADMLDSQFGEIEYINEAKEIAYKIVESNFKLLAD